MASARAAQASGQMPAVLSLAKTWLAAGGRLRSAVAGAVADRSAAAGGVEDGVEEDFFGMTSVEPNYGAEAKLFSGSKRGATEVLH